MTPNEFAIGLMQLTVDDGMKSYRHMFSSARPEDSKDPYGKRALTLYSELSADQREVLFEIIRQVSVDTVSSLLGVIDGVCFIEGATDTYKLTYGQQDLGDDLQSLFLVEEERRTR